MRVINKLRFTIICHFLRARELEAVLRNNLLRARQRVAILHLFSSQNKPRRLEDVI
jgi:hypothetical protein